MKDLIKSWTTRKKTLYFCIVAAIIYTLSDMMITFLYAYTGTQMYFDPTLTTEFFGFLKIISGLGGGLSAADIIADTAITIVGKGKKSKKVTNDEEVKG